MLYWLQSSAVAVPGQRWKWASLTGRLFSKPPLSIFIILVTTITTSFTTHLRHEVITCCSSARLLDWSEKLKFQLYSKGLVNQSLNKILVTGFGIVSGEVSTFLKSAMTTAEKDDYDDSEDE